MSVERLASGTDKWGMLHELQSEGRRVGRWLLAYVVVGPPVTLGLAALSRAFTTARVWSSPPWTTAIWQGVWGIVLLAIIRPRTCNRSPWRALLGSVWFAVPLVPMAAVSLPMFSLSLPPPVAASLLIRSHDLWATLWVGVGCLGSAIAAVVWAIAGLARTSSRSTLDQPAQRELAHRSTPKAGGYVRLGIVVSSLVVTLSAATYQYIVLSFPVAIGRSYIDGNVPDESHFNAYLQRDLSAHFADIDSTRSRMKYVLLRDLPTQLGVSPPTYYVWVVLPPTNGGALRQGVAELAAVDRKGFAVVAFLSSADVISQPELVRHKFPTGLSEEIQRRARAAQR